MIYWNECYIFIMRKNNFWKVNRCVIKMQQKFNIVVTNIVNLCKSTPTYIYSVYFVVDKEY